MNWKKENSASYEATALHFGISSSSLIYKWNRLNEQGKLAQPVKRGRPRKKELIPPHHQEINDLRKQNQALLEEIERLKKAQKISGGENDQRNFFEYAF